MRAVAFPLAVTVGLYFTTTGTQGASNEQACVSNISNGTDYFPDKVIPEYSTRWSMSYSDTYKILNNTASNVTYLLYQCGSDVPPEEAGKHYMEIPVPLQSGIAISETTQIPHLEQLGLRSQIKAYIGDSSYVSSPCLTDMIENGTIATVFNSSDPFNSTSQRVAVDQFVADNPGILILGSSSIANRTLILSETEELDSKAIYEWHKVIGSLFNMERDANDNFQEAVARFDCVVANAELLVQGVPVEPKTERRRTQGKKETVLWAYYSDFEKGWDVGECDPIYNYYCAYADYCSTTLLYSSNGSIKGTYGNAMNDTEFASFAKDADYWIYPSSNWNTMYAKLNDTLSTFKSVAAQQVYDYQGSGEDAWFETRIAEFDVVVQDFCDVVNLYYNDIVPHTRRWFRNVFTEPVGTLGVCNASAIDLPTKSRASECTSLQQATDSVAPSDSTTSGVADQRFTLVLSSILAIIASGVTF